MGRAGRLTQSPSADSISDILSEQPTIAAASSGVSLGRGKIYANLEMVTKQKAQMQEVQKPTTVSKISEKFKDIVLEEKELEPVVKQGKAGLCYFLLFLIFFLHIIFEHIKLCEIINDLQ